VNHEKDERELFERLSQEMAATGTDGNVVDLAEARRRAAADGVDVDQVDSEVDEYYDHETVLIERPELGPPVDRSDEPGAPVRRDRDRAPVVPVWLNSRANIRTSLIYGMKEARYRAGYHAIRTPQYAGKALVYAPVGVARTAHRLGSWAMAERHNWDLRQHAADHGDADTWMKLDARRQRQSRWRWTLVLSLGAIAAAGTAFLTLGPVPTAGKWAALALAVPILARLGRPADKPITDRVTAGKTYRKLTAELVRRALTSIQIGAINQAVAKDPSALSFPNDIHRDGPGQMALVDLPYGVEASDVIARRGRLASALRLPLDQVWPETAPGHTGRLGLWVGFEPASQMKQPAWPLIGGGKVDVFKPFPFATDPRMRPVNAGILERNWLFGGQPGSGKTVSMRGLLLACCLDPRVEIRGYNLKGTGDFRELEPLMVEHGNGIDDDTVGAAAAMLDWLWEECLRRSKRIDHYARAGKAPDNKVTPELASLKGSGLHPMLAFIDEAQNLFAHKEFGKKAGEVAEKVIKLGRALGIILVLGTQIPDKESLPTGITRQVNTRFCLSVMDQTANDMILGTSMYKNGYRATVFEPGEDAGWGIAVGLGKPAALRSYYIDNGQTKKVVARAKALRDNAGTLPAPDEQQRPARAGYDVLADVAAVFPADDEKAWNETLIERLADYRADVYAGWKPEQLTAALAVHGVKVGQVGRRVDGKTVNRRGPARADILAAIAERNRRRAAE
jgi:S-DNA-T family DNA segregation ATPase FtsK/SpoIIIE